MTEKAAQSIKHELTEKNKVERRMRGDGVAEPGVSILMTREITSRLGQPYEAGPRQEQNSCNEGTLAWCISMNRNKCLSFPLREIIVSNSLLIDDLIRCFNRDSW